MQRLQLVTPARFRDRLVEFPGSRQVREAAHTGHPLIAELSLQLYDRLEMRCPGMEFATEMILKAARREARISEVPITLRPDGRKAHRPHLRTFRDGWRTLRFFLMFAPRWTFLEPGKLLVLIGLLGYCVALPGLRIAGVHFSSHTLLVATLPRLGPAHLVARVGVDRLEDTARRPRGPGGPGLRQGVEN